LVVAGAHATVNPISIAAIPIVNTIAVIEAAFVVKLVLAAIDAVLPSIQPILAPISLSVDPRVEVCATSVLGAGLETGAIGVNIGLCTGLHITLRLCPASHIGIRLNAYLRAAVCVGLNIDINLLGNGPA
jgi:hypothetical protein